MLSPRWVGIIVSLFSEEWRLQLFVATGLYKGKGIEDGDLPG
jgi:hypothetical protein